MDYSSFSHFLCKNAKHLCVSVSKTLGFAARLCFTIANLISIWFWTVVWSKQTFRGLNNNDKKTIAMLLCHLQTRFSWRNIVEAEKARWNKRLITALEWH